MNINRSIKLRRVALGLTQKDLAYRAGIAQRTMSTIEVGLPRAEASVIKVLDRLEKEATAPKDGRNGTDSEPQ